MQNQIYEIDAKIEKNHWWFVVRRQMFASYINSFSLNKKTAKILDIGSSSGTNLRMLQDLGFKNYHGFDANLLSQKFCQDKKLGQVIIGDICNSNLESGAYDLIIATDVLEHILDDEKAISEIYRLLKPGGIALITVPCFMMLWSDHDKMLMHKRRYKLAEISQKITAQNLKICESYYFNFLLFLPILLFRKITKLLKIKLRSENKVNSPAINKILKIIFTLDVKISKKLKSPFGPPFGPPFGVSAFILACKENSN